MCVAKQRYCPTYDLFEGRILRDAMTQPKGYVSVEYLQAIGEFVKQLKERTYILMNIQMGHKVLDVGCGPASDTVQLAAFVGETGEVHGVDYDQAMIDEAEQRSAKAGVSAWVKHQCADSGSMPFESDYFDACRSERLFQHLPDPERTLSEMVRVTKPGGWIIVLDTDWGTLSIDTTEVDIERRLARVNAESSKHNGYAGRQLYRFFRQQGLTDIDLGLHPLLVRDYGFLRQGGSLDLIEQIAVTEGVVTEEEVKRWHANLEQADASGQLFSTVNQVMAVGRKPH